MAELNGLSLLSDANLQLYYRFESNLTDSSSGGHNGTGEGSPGYVAGKYGNAVSLTNAGNKRVLTNWTPAFGTGQFSIACWINASAVDSQQGICSTLNGTALQGFALKLGGGTNIFQFQCFANGSSVDTINAATAPTLGLWYHVVAVRDGTNLNIYVNGVSDATPVTSTPRNVSGGVALRVGSANSTSVGDLAEWDGYIDDFAIFDRALTAAEVKQLYLDIGGSFLLNFV